MGSIWAIIDVNIGYKSLLQNLPLEKVGGISIYNKDHLSAANRKFKMADCEIHDADIRNTPFLIHQI